MDSNCMNINPNILLNIIDIETCCIKTGNRINSVIKRALLSGVLF